MSAFEAAFAEHFKLTRAIEAVWRRTVVTAAELPLGDVIGWVIAKCPDADRDYVRRELMRRFERYRPRRARQIGGAP